MKGFDLSMFVFFQFCCTLTHLGIWLACRKTDAVVLLPVFSLGAKSGASSYHVSPRNNHHELNYGSCPANKLDSRPTTLTG